MIKKLTLMLLVASVLFSSLSYRFTQPVSADNWGAVWSDYWNRWEDVRCYDPDPNFVVVVFEGSDFTGQKFKICGHIHNFSRYNLFNNNLSYSWDNRISSIWIKSIPSGKCLTFYQNKDYGGNSYTFHSSVSKSDLDIQTGNNTYSSLRRTDC